jgi:hypothetical protein
VLSFIYSAPDGNQHGNDHDGSGGMRESRHDVDDAGDASNTEIGHVAYLPSRTSIAITPCVRSCRIWGLLGEEGISGRDSRGGPKTGYRLSSNCDAKPACVPVREPATMALCEPAAGIATNESDLADGNRRSGILCQALFRADFTVVSIRRGMQKHTQGKHACSTARADSDDSPKNENVPTLVRVTGRSIKQPPPGVCSQPSVAWSYFPKLYKSDQSLMP